MFSLAGRGERNVIGHHWQYTYGPYRGGFSYDWHKFERDFTGDGASTKLGDARVNVLLVRHGFFVWGPKGFLSGDENGGVMVAFNHFRNYFDAGSGYANTSFNSLSAMRRTHVIENIGLIRYFYKPNIIYAIEYAARKFDRMKGLTATDTAAESRRRGGIRASGGTYQQVILALKYNF
jgi:hypothetical protein